MSDVRPEQNWFEKADQDLEIARRALEPGKPLPGIACYHAQQCAEKYLKGYLTAYRLIESAWESNRASAVLAAELIRLHAGRGDPKRAETVLAEFGEHATAGAMREVAEVLAAVRRNT